MKGYLYADDSYLWMSYDLSSWTQVDGPASGQYVGLAYNGSRWLAIGTTGADIFVRYSDNGVNWYDSGFAPGHDFDFPNVPGWNGAIWIVSTGMGYIYTSPDGITWTEQDDGLGLPHDWSYWYDSITVTDVISITTGSDGADALIMTSTDGVNWQRLPQPTGWAEVFKVAPVNDLFVALGDGKAHSYDLLSWNEDEASNDAYIITVGPGQVFTFSYTGSITSGDPSITTSEVSADGISWSAGTPPEVGAPGDAIYSDQYVVVGSVWVPNPPIGYDITDYLAYSSDGSTWTAGTNPSAIGNSAFTLRYGDIGMAATASALLLSSPDHTFACDAVITQGLYLWRAGVSFSPDTNIYASTDGETWVQEAVLPSNTYVDSIAYDSNIWLAGIDDGYLLRAVGDDSFSTVFRDDLVSAANGTQYVPINSFASNGLGTWVATDQYGRFFRSTDAGSSWSVARRDDWDTATRVIWTGTQFVVFVWNWFILPGQWFLSSSSDGSSWSPQGVSVSWPAPADSGNWAQAFAYGNGTYVIGRKSTSNTSANKIAYSTDSGVTWTVVSSPFSGSGNYPLWAEYGNGLFVIVGRKGTIATSPDGISWTQRTYPGSNTDSLEYVYYFHRWFISSTGGTYVSDDGITWHLAASGPPDVSLFAGSFRTTPGGQFQANAVFNRPTATFTYTADAVVAQGFFRADARVMKPRSGSFTASATSAYYRPADIDVVNATARNRHDRADTHFGTMYATDIAHDSSTILEDVVRDLWQRISEYEESDH